MVNDHLTILNYHLDTTDFMSVEDQFRPNCGQRQAIPRSAPEGSGKLVG